MTKPQYSKPKFSLQQFTNILVANASHKHTAEQHRSYFDDMLQCGSWLASRIVSALTLPQSLWLVELAEAILDFFLLSFSFSPARTTSFVSLRQAGQYLGQDK